MEQREGLVKFQYITCYSLSFRWELHSVTVFLFQYITCYSLSLRVFSDLVRVLMFQYITCYSLSDVQHLLLVNYIGFNTSHVTLYHSLLKISFLIIPFQYITCYSLSIELADKVLPKNRFNTSHVTLYRLQIRRPGNRKHVSIHHMLLFIYGLEVVFTSVIWFQYITCYSLS